MHRCLCRVLLIVSGIIIGGPLPSLWAVVVSTTSENLTRPDDDPGWDNVGILKNATAVYLGNRWVLTADHLGAGTVEFPGIGEFAPDLPTEVQLSNPTFTGLNQPADLVLFQLLEDPGLPPVRISRSTPPVAGEVVMIGHGLDPEPEPTYWDVNQVGAVWNWTETEAPGEYSGFKTTSTTSIRWGNNLVEDEEEFRRERDSDIVTTLVQDTTRTISFITEFDLDGSLADDDVVTGEGSSATSFESQAVLLDSGGSTFYRPGELWELAGIILAVEGHRNQPDVTRNAIYGNLTFQADLATYFDEIEDYVVFGDLNADLTLDIGDIDQNAAALNAEEYIPLADLNHDGEVSFQDRELLVNVVFETYFGDSNLDGEFGTADLVHVLQFGQYEDAVVGNSSWNTGDWNGDGEFDSSDLVIALQGGGFEQGPRVALQTRSVPEPIVSHGLLALAITFFMRRNGSVRRR